MSEEYLIYKKNPIRIFLNILIFISIFLGLYYFFIGNIPIFGFNFLFTAPLALLLPRFLYKHFGWYKTYPVSLIKFLEILFSTVIIAGSLGSIWLYTTNAYYDWLMHFFIGGILALILSLFLFIWQPMALKRGVTTFGFYLMIPLSVLWEGYEFFGDKILGTQMFGSLFRPPLLDTTVDIGLTISGAAFVAFLLYHHYWHSFLKLTTPKEKIPMP